MLCTDREVSPEQKKKKTTVGEDTRDEENEVSNKDGRYQI